ncbi:hypothetical protein VPH1244_0054 [Vibrio phage 1244]
MKAKVQLTCSACSYDLPSIDCEVCAGEVFHTEVMDVEPLNPEPQLNQMFDAFNAQYGIKTQPLNHNLDGMYEIVSSEFDEWMEEVSEPLFGDGEWIPEPKDFVKEGLDVIYAMTQQLRERGVDVDAGLAEVHRSNMSKVVEENDLEAEMITAEKRYPDVMAYPIGNHRYVLKSPSQGKVVKPTRYSPAAITPEIINPKSHQQSEMKEQFTKALHQGAANAHVGKPDSHNF